jgi:hypothetical protein
MKKNKLRFIITIVLFAMAVFFIYTATKSTIPKGVKDFAVEDTSIITKIFLSDKENKNVLLEKKSPGSWTLNNKFQASTDLMNIFIKTLHRLEVKSPVAKAARNNVVKRISSIGVKVEIYQTIYRIDIWGLKLFPHEKLTKTYYVGDVTQDMLGTYMLMDGYEDPFIIHIPGFNGFLSSRYSTVANDWRDHSLFSVELPNIKSLKMEFPSSPESSYIAENTGKVNFKLTALRSNTVIPDYDTTRLLDCLSAFRDIKFELLINDSKEHNKDSVIASTPYHIITLTDVAGNTTVVKTFHKHYAADQPDDISGKPSLFDQDRLYALINDGKDFALIQFYVFDRILRPLPYFLKPGPGKAPAKPNVYVKEIGN